MTSVYDPHPVHRMGIIVLAFAVVIAHIIYSVLLLTPYSCYKLLHHF